MKLEFAEQRERMAVDSPTFDLPNHTEMNILEMHSLFRKAARAPDGWVPSEYTGRKTRFLGVDVGQYTGLALWDPELDDFLFMGSYNYWRAIHAALGMVDARLDVIVVEDPGLNKHQHNLHAQDTKRSAASKGQDAGRVMQDTRRFIEFFRLLGFAVWQAKVNNTKLSNKDWRRHTGASSLWTRSGVASQHARDAGVYSGGQAGTISVWRQKCGAQAALNHRTRPIKK